MLSFCKVKDDHYVKDSFDGAYGLTLDIDDGFIEEFKEMWEYECIIHTTHSHKTGLKGENDYFRVIIPLYYDISVKAYDRLIDGFYEMYSDKIVGFDDSFKDKPRGFIIPPKDGIVEKIEGKTFPFKKIIQNQMFKPVNKTIPKKKKKSFKKPNCINMPSVKNYLNTSFNSITGNGNSNNMLYKAICCCVKNEDEQTLDMVVDKARSESWTDNEIKYKITKAEEWK